MNVTQKLYKDGLFSEDKGTALSGKGQTLVLAFGDKNIIEEENFYNLLKDDYKFASVVLCSTAGEIFDDRVYDKTVSVIAIEFEKTYFKTLTVNINSLPDSFEAGKCLFNGLQSNDLCYVMVISDGSLVNGSELVRGIEQVNTANIPVTGGLAGDAANFDYTVVGCNEKPQRGNIVAIGFYGVDLKVGHSFFGGWEIFGTEKRVTKSVSNRLFEIDGKSALDLYKQYLGKYADELPGSALLFPLNVRQPGSENTVVRTILSIDNDQQCMVFAGDIPEGSYVRLMKATFDKLIDGATSAAVNALTTFDQPQDDKPKLALLISCVGRKLILGKRTDEEIETIKDIFGGETLLGGFYSYGEISPLGLNARCELQNQTMTITTFNEA